VQTSTVLAALPPWAAALLWVLAILGAAVFVYRRVTGAGRTAVPTLDDPDPLLHPDPSPGTGSGFPAGPAATPSAFFVEPTPDRPGIPLAADAPGTTPGEPPAPVDPEPPASPGGPAPPFAAGSSGRAGYFAPSSLGSAPGAPGDEAAGTRRMTVAEALRGIAMPCGLSPVIDGSVSIPNPFRVAFLTTTADAATVGASLGDELERLGYQLTTATTTEVLARKPGVDLHVVLYPSPATATRGLEQLFPVAPPGSVGIEFST
jgi:hypothetical protein